MLEKKKEELSSDVFYSLCGSRLKELLRDWDTEKPNCAENEVSQLHNEIQRSLSEMCNSQVVMEEESQSDPLMCERQLQSFRHGFGPDCDNPVYRQFTDLFKIYGKAEGQAISISHI